MKIKTDKDYEKEKLMEELYNKIGAEYRNLLYSKISILNKNNTVDDIADNYEYITTIIEVANIENKIYNILLTDDFSIYEAKALIEMPKILTSLALVVKDNSAKVNINNNKKLSKFIHNIISLSSKLMEER